MSQLYYNIHDLVSIKVNYNEPWHREFFNKKLSYFTDNPTKEYDIIINLAEPDAKVNKLDVMNKFKLVNDNLHYFGFRKFAWWYTCIKGLCAKTTKIFFQGNKLSFKYFYFNLIEPLINYYLMMRGHCLIHSSCFTFNGRGYIVNAYPGGGKTTAVLKILNKGGDYLSDEMTILSEKGIALSYPLPVTLCDYNLKDIQELENDYCLHIKNYMRKFIRVLTRGAVKLPLNFHINDIFPDVSIIKEAEIYKMYLISLDEKELSSGNNNFVTELININKFQYRSFEHMRLYYVSKIKHKGLMNYWEHLKLILSESLHNCSYSRIYDHNTIYSNIVDDAK